MGTPPFGVMLVNLGTPEKPEPAAVRAYLQEFLWDRRVVDVPRWIWWPVLHGIILRFRPSRVAKAYASVWQPDGSPLMVHSKAQRQALQEALTAEYGTDILPDAGISFCDPRRTETQNNTV